MTRWCSCDTSRRRFTASNRSRPKCSTHCRARADRPGPSASPVSGAHWLRSSARWCWCSTICTLSPVWRVWTCSQRCLTTSRRAHRSRSRAGKRRNCRLLAGARAEVCTRSAWRSCGWMSRRPPCCCGPRGSSSIRASCPSSPSGRRAGPPACTWRRCRCRRGRQARPAPRALPAMTGSCPSTFASSCYRGCRRPRHGFSSTRRCWIACAAGCATPCFRRGGRATRSRRSSAQTASSCRSTGEASGTGITTCSASYCTTSSSAASRTWCPRSTLVRWLGASPTTCPRQRSSTVTLPVRRTRWPAWWTPSPCQRTTTAGWRPWRSGSGGSAMTSYGGIRHSPSTGPGSAR